MNDTKKTDVKTKQRTPKHASRRDFLTAAATGAGVLIGASAFAQEAAPAEAAEAAPAVVTPPKSVGRELNIAMIGTGAEGMVLIESMHGIPGLRFQAVCDIWDYSRQRGSKTLKKYYGYDVNDYEDYQDLLANEKGLDAVVVATPDFMHAEHAMACMNAGLHVYCEKEMSNNLDLARQMVLTSRETKRLLQIGHQRRSNPRYHHAIKTMILGNKLLGRVTQANAQWNRAKGEDLSWGKRYEMPPEKLLKYGYDSMQHFRNWRWYKKYGGGPIVDLGSHQIDIFAWVFGSCPKSVMAGGGVDFYSHHEWYDNVMAVYEYDTPEGVSRAFYQVLTTTSYGQYQEIFMGENGSLQISENPEVGNAFRREVQAPDWEPYIKSGLLLAPPAPEVSTEVTKDIVADVRNSPQDVTSYEIPVELAKLPHRPHLENFFDAIRNGTPLNCPGEIGYETAVAVLKVNEAVEAGHKLEFKPEEFIV